MSRSAGARPIRSPRHGLKAVCRKGLPAADHDLTMTKLIYIDGARDPGLNVSWVLFAALLRYVKAMHGNGHCGGNGRHRAECSVL
jgi:hypothetical protein